MNFRLNSPDANLLRVLESACVDNNCRIAASRLTQSDLDTAKNWNATGFIQFGEIKSCPRMDRNFFIFLGDEAWKAAAQLRQDRATRAWISRDFEVPNGNNAH